MNSSQEPKLYSTLNQYYIAHDCLKLTSVESLVLFMTANATNLIKKLFTSLFTSVSLPGWFAEFLIGVMTGQSRQKRASAFFFEKRAINT